MPLSSDTDAGLAMAVALNSTPNTRLHLDGGPRIHPNIRNDRKRPPRVSHHALGCAL